jgi:hypothetical protein
VTGESQQITVTASAAGHLDAWIDFNRDGDWDDLGEQIFNNRSLAAGANNLTVNVPTIAAPGESYARFRFSAAGGLAPTGPAASGEVEDYRVEIVPLVSYTLQINYTNGRELYRDLLNRYFVAPGLEIVAEVYADDNRTVGAAGVRQAFADLVYDNDLIDFDPASLQFGPTFSSGQTGTVDDTNMEVNEAGGVAPVQPANADRQLLFRVKGTVKTSALPDQTFSMTINAADDSPAHDTLLFNNGTVVLPSYESETLIVEANAWQNAAHPLDVNASRTITGLDALIIINRLNLKGPAILPPPGQPIPPDTDPGLAAFPQPFYDVNGDGRLTALDALRIINHLNTAGPGPVLSAAGDDEESIVVAAATPATSLASGMPLASSFDVTPVAISVAGTGSTAAAPAIARLAEGRAAASAAAIGTAMADLFTDEDEPASVRVHQAAPTVELLAEALADGGDGGDGNCADDPTTLSVARLRACEFEGILEALGLEATNKKKKGLFTI